MGLDCFHVGTPRKGVAHLYFSWDHNGGKDFGDIGHYYFITIDNECGTKAEMKAAGFKNKKKHHD